MESFFYEVYGGSDSEKQSFYVLEISEIKNIPIL